MRRVLSVLLVMALLLTAVPMSMLADAASQNDLEFEINSDGNSYTVVGCDADAVGQLKIPSTYGGKAVTHIGSAAFYDCDGLTSVTIPDSVVTIGASAFSGCDALGSIVIPDSVTIVESEAFYECISLESAKLSKKLKTISNNLFAYCSSLTAISIPDTVTKVKENAFAYCTALKKVTVGNKVEFMGETVFKGCTALEEVVYNAISFSITSFDSYTLDYPAFHNMTSIKTVTIGEKVEYLPYDLFEGCTGIETLRYNAIKCYDGYILDSECNLRNFIIGKKVEHIPGYICEGMVGLTSLTIPNNVESIGDNAFADCTGLTEVIVGNGVEFIGSSAFSRCSALRKVVLGKKVHTIYYEAFYWCENLKEITIPHRMTRIQSDAFAHCSKLKDVYYDGSTVDKKNIDIWSGNKRLTSATWHCSSVFADVKEKDFFYTPVLWAVQEGITAGATKTKFEPNEPCTRGQIVTFLWRAAGCPEVYNEWMPFVDVDESDYYFTAVLWAVDEGITSGVTYNRFAPDAPCTRGQIATFLWRASGYERPNSFYNPFVDVHGMDYYYSAVLWAVDRGVTAGATRYTFEPNSPCTRGQIVTFLYRYYN